ncbi:MAG: hypothetical protein ABIA75_10210 [Candidatus Neomarinimicrobiota bacterium]
MEAKFRSRIEPWFDRVLILAVFMTRLGAVGAGLQISTYFDSNVSESSTRPMSSLGLKLRGNLEHGIVGKTWSAGGYLLTQTYLDAIYREQSKMVVNSGLNLGYRISPALQAEASFDHFQKSFYSDSYSYRWSDYRGGLVYGDRDGRRTTRLYLLRRSTVYSVLDSIKILFSGGEWRYTGRFDQHWLLAIISRGGHTDYENYPAWAVENDTTLIPLDHDQSDRQISGTLHFRYQGRLIFGLAGDYELNKSNSAIGDYHQFGGRGYLSARLGDKVMLHVIIQRVNKLYRRADLAGISAYRDPEERIQNRTYLQLERTLTANGIGYLQFSLLANETVLNRQYYNKGIVEAGIKFKL